MLVLHLPLAAAVNSPVGPREGPLSEESDSPRPDPDVKSLSWFWWLLQRIPLDPGCIVVRPVKRYIDFPG